MTDGHHNYGMVDKAEENRIRELTQEYINFFDDSAEENIYSQKIEDLIHENGCRLIIDINDIRRRSKERANGLVKNFVEEVICLEHALKEVITRLDPEFSKDHEFRAGFEGSFGDRHVNPRSLKSSFLGNLVCCEGIVTRCSAVRPKIVKSVHYCVATKKTLEKKYGDFTSYDAVFTSSAYPKEDENKNPLETEFGRSVYKDHQIFSIQELPENAPAGHLPRNVDVIADEDLADSCKPGDRVQVIALYRVLPNKQGGSTSGNFRSILIANNIKLMSKDVQPSFETEDIKNIRRMSRHKDIFELLARSLAPSIYGHEEVKKAILCLLLGGTEKMLENGTRLRGDINVLMIGDPSVAKSQLLRYVLHTAPRVIGTTGRGSSGVGLTAAVVHDPDSNERRLEAGAMVLADRGIVCIDEFDKMSDIDRTAIHEVMEQGRVTISKAGIHAKLNARCSVLAAANPVLGRYNVFKSPMENIGMQDSLLSRFDLIFVLLDEHSIERDGVVAENVLKLHRYRTPGEPAGSVLQISSNYATMSTFAEDQESFGSTEVYEKNREWTAIDDSKRILSANFIRKYIHMAKGMKPQLSEEASNYISERYSELRSTDMSRTDYERTMPVTARQLETLIRVSTAIAKSHLAKVVELADAKKAYELLYFACFKEKPKERLEFEEQKRHKRKHDENTNDVSDEEMETDEVVTSTYSTRTRSTRQKLPTQEEEILSDSHITDDHSIATEPASKKARSEEPSISVDRYKKLKTLLRKAFDDANVSENESVEVSVIRNSIQSQAGSQKFTDQEFEAAFEQLSAENIIFVNEEMVTLI